jgi:hypothetical protein
VAKAATLPGCEGLRDSKNYSKLLWPAWIITSQEEYLYIGAVRVLLHQGRVLGSKLFSNAKKMVGLHFDLLEW